MCHPYDVGSSALAEYSSAQTASEDRDPEPVGRSSPIAIGAECSPRARFGSLSKAQSQLTYGEIPDSRIPLAFREGFTRTTTRNEIRG